MSFTWYGLNHGTDVDMKRIKELNLYNPPLYQIRQNAEDKKIINYTLLKQKILPFYGRVNLNNEKIMCCLQDVMACLHNVDSSRQVVIFM